MSDDEIVEAMARAIFAEHSKMYIGTHRWENDPKHWLRYARAVLAVARPAIEAAAIERALESVRRIRGSPRYSEWQYMTGLSDAEEAIRALAVPGVSEVSGG